MNVFIIVLKKKCSGLYSVALTIGIHHIVDFYIFSHFVNSSFK